MLIFKSQDLLRLASFFFSYIIITLLVAFIKSIIQFSRDIVFAIPPLTSSFD